MSKTSKNEQAFFRCEFCDYTTMRKSNLSRHLSTRKHQFQHFQQNGNKNEQDHLSSRFVCSCGKSYKDRTGLWKHKKQCLGVSKTEQDKTEDSIPLDTREILQSFIQRVEGQEAIVSELLKENRKLQEKQIEAQNDLLRDIIPRIGDNVTHQQFNVQIFLNEKCKNALNISDFVDSLDIRLQDLRSTQEKGLMHSISSLIVNKLKALDVCERPIHCTDLKRHILYVKDEEAWQKDEQQTKLRTTIRQVANKQRMAIKQWEDAHPGWQNSDRLKDEYMRLVSNVMRPADEDEAGQNKIIKRLSNVTMIEKK